jgi:hypothetical protein
MTRVLKDIEITRATTVVPNKLALLPFIRRPASLVLTYTSKTRPVPISTSLDPFQTFEEEATLWCAHRIEGHAGFGHLVALLHRKMEHRKSKGRGGSGQSATLLGGGLDLPDGFESAKRRLLERAWDMHGRERHG